MNAESPDQGDRGHFVRILKGRCSRVGPRPARKHGYPFGDRWIGPRPLAPRNFPGIGAFLG
jgi:hypothetical protein